VLQATVDKLDSMNKELQDFAFIASHDLQEPLRKIQTFCDMAIKRCANSLDDTSKSYMDRVSNSAKRMRQLLHELLLYSRVGTQAQPFTLVDLGKVAREAVDIFEIQIKRAGCQVEIGPMPKIEADESQFLRLFQNLLGNALKFRNGDKTPEIKIHGMLKGQGQCEIIVRDNGIGFDQQHAELIFKPFQRLHGRGEYDGTGMGLSICRKIVERHHGTITAESEPGKGTTFIIRVPAKQSNLE